MANGNGNATCRKPFKNPPRFKDFVSKASFDLGKSMVMVEKAALDFGYRILSKMSPEEIEDLKRRWVNEFGTKCDENPMVINLTADEAGCLADRQNETPTLDLTWNIRLSCWLAIPFFLTAKSTVNFKLPVRCMGCQ